MSATPVTFDTNDWNSAPAEVRLKLSSPSDESLELFD